MTALFTLHTAVRRRAHEKAEREPQVPTVPKAVAAALLGAAFLAIGVAILVSSLDLPQSDGFGRYGWVPRGFKRPCS